VHLYECWVFTLLIEMLMTMTPVLVEMGLGHALVLKKEFRRDEAPKDTSEDQTEFKRN
jgi:hypothetical protein